MGRFIFALTVLGLLAGSLYAVNAGVRADIRNHPQPKGRSCPSLTLPIFATNNPMLPCGKALYRNSIILITIPHYHLGISDLVRRVCSHLQ